LDEETELKIFYDSLSKIFEEDEKKRLEHFEELKKVFGEENVIRIDKSH
jgi:hypothetical protein